MFRRLRVLLVFVLPLVSLAAPAAASAPSIAVPRPGPAQVRLVDADWNGRILVEVSWRRPAGSPLDPTFLVTLNGREVSWDQVGAASGGGREEATLAIAPARYGRLAFEVTVVAGDRRFRGRVSTRFQPTAAIVPDWADSELLVTPRSLRFAFRHTRIHEVRLNGEAAEYGVEKDMPLDHTTYHAAILESRFRPGVNVLEVVHVDHRGETRTARSTVYHAPGGEITAGAEFSLTYGVVGSRSGPFFRVAVPPELVAELSDVELPDGRLVKRYRATSPGQGALVVEKKAHFRGSWEVERTIPVRVTR